MLAACGDPRRLAARRRDLSLIILELKQVGAERVKANSDPSHLPLLSDTLLPPTFATSFLPCPFASDSPALNARPVSFPCFLLLLDVGSPEQGGFALLRFLNRGL